MAQNDILSSLEMLLLAAIMDLGEEAAYGLAVYDRARQLAGKLKIAYGSLYPTLDRLEEKGFISSGLSTAHHAGRARRFFRLEARGEAAYNANLSMMHRLPKLTDFGMEVS